eukprot:TRINITY_DN8967_c0_g1_i1.p1 TRINITY_DN8967_c0_g1~~TRINITY_DN8967_c0_g1_i1.p1  ORF type:complete len:796 (-),score=236.81 TRINITY_DN8967_c0_g1_i1:141-2528(-)
MTRVWFPLVAFVIFSDATAVPKSGKGLKSEKSVFENFGNPLDCQFRELALEYSQKVLNNQGANAISAALNLSACPGHAASDVAKERPWVAVRPHKAADDSATFYVSVNGSDTNDGSESAPFATLSAARAAIRQLGPVGSRPSVTVYVRQGTYYLQETFELTWEDSGSATSPIVYAAYPGESVTISGGVPLYLDWSSYQNGISAASVPSYVAPFTTMFANQVRQVRARYPNGDPAKAVAPAGYIYSLKGGPAGPLGGLPIQVSTPSRDYGSWGSFQSWAGGQINRYENGFTSPNAGVISESFIYDNHSFSHNVWKQPELAVVHMFHTYAWGNWQYEVESIDYPSNTVYLGRGAFQEGRGAPIQSNMFYVDNVFEELDAPTEWYLDAANSVLYYMPGDGIDLSTAVLVAPQLETLVRIAGLPGNPVTDITFTGFTFTHSTTTYLNRYEVPSGGDWAIARTAAVFVQDAADITITQCFFDQPGGNGVMFSNWVKNSTVSDSEFVFMGDSAVCLLGSTREYNGMQDTNPSGNSIVGNHIHEIGIYGKQTAGYFQSLSGGSNYIANNVIYNGPRAGILFNDGFHGGDIVEGNLVFNMVRETGDHGMFNSWDRLPYVWFNGTDAVVQTLYFQIRNNFMINLNYATGQISASWTLDHDDGSSMYNDTNNVLLYGGIKFRDGMNRTASYNLIVNDNMHVADFQVLYANSHDTFFENIGIDLSGHGGFYGCDELPNRVPAFFTFNNVFATPTNQSLPFVINSCSSQHIQTLAAWQALGYDKGSVIIADITNTTILQEARNRLGL